MTTIVNSPAPTTDSGISGLLIGAIIIGLIVVVSYFGIPAIKNMRQPQINVAAPQIVVPDKIDVNVQQK